jgi:hypothetical protein
MNCVDVSAAIKLQGLDDLTRCHSGSLLSRSFSYAVVKLLFILVYGSLFAIGLVGNGGVIAAVAQNKRLRSARNIFLCELLTVLIFSELCQ